MTTKTSKRLASLEQRRANRIRYGTRNEPAGYKQNPIMLSRQVKVNLSFVGLRIGQFTVNTLARSKKHDETLDTSRLGINSHTANHMVSQLYTKLQYNGLTQGQQLREYPLTVALVTQIVQWPARYGHWVSSPVKSKSYYGDDSMSHMLEMHTPSQHSYVGCNSIEGFAWNLIKHIAEMSDARRAALSNIDAYTKLCAMIFIAKKGKEPLPPYNSTAEWKSTKTIVEHVKRKQDGSLVMPRDMYIQAACSGDTFVEVGRSVGKSWTLQQMSEHLDSELGKNVRVHYSKSLLSKLDSKGV